MYKRNPLNYFARPFLARMPLRMVTLFLLTALYIGFDEVSFAESVTDIAFWIFVIPAVFFFVRSFMVGLRYRNGVFTYRSYFRKRTFRTSEIEYFWFVDDDSWADIVLGSFGELFSSPGVFFKSGEKISLSACTGLMPNVDRKLIAINSLVNPSWTAPSADDDDSSPWQDVKSIVKDIAEEIREPVETNTESGQTHYTQKRDS